MREADEANMSKVLPKDSARVHRASPWLLHSLHVNTLNFCAFSMCFEHNVSDASLHPTLAAETASASSPPAELPIFVAVPAANEKMIDIHQLPSEKLAYKISNVQANDTGEFELLWFAFDGSAR